MSQAIMAAIAKLEDRRCAALVRADIDELDRLLADDLVHVHGTGKIDDKPGYLEGVRTKYQFLTIERGDLNIRLYGDVAVVVGPLAQTLRPIGSDQHMHIAAIVTQTWVRAGDRWQQNTCHTGFLSQA